MKMKGIACIWCAVFLLALIGQVAAQDGATLKVSVSGFQNDKGDAKISIFNSKESFAAGDTGFRAAVLPIKGGKAEWVLSGLPYGTYAIKIYHDENGNGKLDKNSFGMPKEKYGFSNNARGSFGPPGYDQVAFTFNNTNNTITITVE
ncbi:MAG TPA: DUF2141 domain-containing protein [Syntrophorhabdaceae bacterium]|jgi:uncharacterized protein (DUF2141 family)